MSAVRVSIDLDTQVLELREGPRLVHRCLVSTARNGAGERHGSECTPRGRHVIAAKIGDDAPINAVFVARQPTGEIYTPALRAAAPGRDFILTRILWLSGCEPGRNAGGEVDTYRRYIYLHGAPDDVAMGQPGSRGCVRLHNDDLLTVYAAVTVGTEVEIRGGG